MRVVFDTNILVSALRSSEGASFAIMKSLPHKKFTPVLSVPLYTEYQDVLLRSGMLPDVFTEADVLDFCRYLASISYKQEIFFLWRPLLPDPKDDLVLELAVAAQSKYIITFNLSHFKEAALFGIKPISPSEFIKKIGGLL